MKPKEKAQELLNSFYQPLGYLKCGVNNTIMWEHAKQCALIAVDEIIDAIIGTYDFDIINEYWQEVKQEIENL